MWPAGPLSDDTKNSQGERKAESCAFDVSGKGRELRGKKGGERAGEREEHLPKKLLNIPMTPEKAGCKGA